MRILTRYILREVTSHALLGGALFTFILFMRDLGRILELVVRDSASLRRRRPRHRLHPASCPHRHHPHGRSRRHSSRPLPSRRRQRDHRHARLRHGRHRFRSHRLNRLRRRTRSRPLQLALPRAPRRHRPHRPWRVPEIFAGLLRGPAPRLLRRVQKPRPLRSGRPAPQPAPPSGITSSSPTSPSPPTPTSSPPTRPSSSTEPPTHPMPRPSAST